MAAPVSPARRAAPDTAHRPARLREAAALLVVLVVAGLALLLAYQTAASYRVEITDPGLPTEIESVYAPERNADFGNYRWTAGSTTVRLRPIGAPMRVRLRIAGWRPGATGNPEARITLSGRELARVQTSNTPQDVDLYIPRTTGVLSDLTLRIETSTFVYPGDPRDLGLVLMGVEASSGAEWPKPALPNRAPLAQVLLGAALLYAAGRLGGARQRWAVVFALAASALPVVLLALDRGRYAQWLWLWPVVTTTALALAATHESMGRLFSQVGAAVRSDTLPPVAYIGQRRAAIPAWLVPALIGMAVAVTVAHPLAALLPPDDGLTSHTRWGLDFYTRLPGWLQWAGVAAVLAFALPPANRAALHLLSGLWGYVAKGNAYVLLVVASVLSTIVLWLLRTRSSLGDSEELLSKIAGGSMWREREPLDYYIHFKLAHALAGLGATPLGVYQVTSVLAGGLAVAGVVLAAWMLAPKGRRWLPAGLALTSGNMLLFAGYVESYTFVTLPAVWFLVAVLMYVRGTAPAYLPAALLALAMWMHPLAAFLLPVLVAALPLRRDTPRHTLLDAGAMLAAGLLVSALVASVFLLEGYSWERWAVARGQLGGLDPGLFKPLVNATGPNEYYPILSWQHLGAVVQEQLMVAPLSLATCVLAWVAFRGRWQTARREIALVAVAAASALLFSVTWNPDLGARRDWDLLSLPAIPLGLLVGALLASGWPHHGNGEARPYSATLAYTGSVLVAAQGWHTLAWLLANAVGAM
jgi:hypothetical protein